MNNNVLVTGNRNRIQDFSLSSEIFDDNKNLKTVVNKIIRTLSDRRHGAAVIHWNKPISQENLLAAFVNLSHAIGMPLPDLGSKGKICREITTHFNPTSELLKSASFHVNPSLPFPLHSDGAYHLVPPDWLGIAMIEDGSTGGGRSALLHIDDWKERYQFQQSVYGNRIVTWLPPTKIDDDELQFFNTNDLRTSPEAAVFSDGKTGVEIRYFFGEKNSAVGSCVIADNDQIEYLKKLGESLQKSIHINLIKLNPGEILFANNRFMVHGREPFAVKSPFKRRIFRIRGRFN